MTTIKSILLHFTTKKRGIDSEYPDLISLMSCDLTISSMQSKNTPYFPPVYFRVHHKI